MIEKKLLIENDEADLEAAKAYTPDPEEQNEVYKILAYHRYQALLRKLKEEP